MQADVNKEEREVSEVPPFLREVWMQAGYKNFCND